jgi:hypothetical protein
MQKKQRLCQPTQIEINSPQKYRPDDWHHAVLSRDPSIDYNIISFDLVTQVLQVIVHSINEKMEPCAPAYYRGERIEGYVDLTWCFANNNKRIQTTRFWVTSTKSPCYDVILGREDAEQCGLTRRKRRHWWFMTR